MHKQLDKAKLNLNRSIVSTGHERSKSQPGTWLVDNRPETINQAVKIQSILQQKPACIQRMGWTWNGENWAPNDPGTTISPPQRDGKGSYEYFDDGKEEAEEETTPEGYTLTQNQMGKQSAYVKNENEYNISALAMDHLVEVANGDSGRAHRSRNITGNSSPTYVHPSDHELYTYTIDGTHTDGTEKISVLEQGKVRRGRHLFKK